VLREGDARERKRAIGGDLVKGLARCLKHDRKDAACLRTAANKALGHLAVAAQPSFEDLIAGARPRPKEDPAVLEARRAEAARRAAEDAFLSTPASAHAAALMRHCDTFSKNARLTAAELEGAVRHPVYADVARWLLADRASEFKARDADGSRTLGLDELEDAVDAFQTRIATARKASEDAADAEARAAEAAEIRARRDVQRRESLAQREAEMRELALSKLPPEVWAARAVARDVDASGNRELSLVELDAAISNRSRFSRFLAWLRPHLGALDADGSRSVGVDELATGIGAYLREVYDDDALNAVARRPASRGGE